MTSTLASFEEWLRRLIQCFDAPTDSQIVRFKYATECLSLADSVEKLPGECFVADFTQQCVALPEPEAISLSDMIRARRKISRSAGPGSFSTLSAQS
ncbi:hypothetical protein [Azospirillum sp. TSO22-1]|uniref:hypothetical protein n=1 Tax=Azospirillum sp. TSO22-1 TaxID=716789 RepID=UPI0011B72C48|nr:hypothetical protein [Azospirillum sp. TSO22-1]